MELDELKKSWNAWDDQLGQHPLVNEQEMEQLIDAGKADTHRKLKRLNLWQRISLYVGLGMFLLLIPACLWAPEWMTDEKGLRQKIILLLVFLAVSVIGGLVWDWRTYRWLRSIHIDRMSVVEVSRRMTNFRQRMRNEVIGACIWLVVFNALNFWVMGYHQAPPVTQALVIALLLVVNGLIVYLLYKKGIYKHINDIHKNIEELKDLCTE